MISYLLSKHGADINQIVILTKQEVLGDIVGNNHNEELPIIKHNSFSVSDLAKKVAEEYFNKNRRR